MFTQSLNNYQYRHRYSEADGRRKKNGREKKNPLQNNKRTKNTTGFFWGAGKSNTDAKNRNSIIKCSAKTFLEAVMCYKIIIIIFDIPMISAD